MSDNEVPKQFQRGVVDKVKDLAHGAVETVKDGFHAVVGEGRADYKAEHKDMADPMNLNDKGVEYTAADGERMIRLP